MSDKKKTFVDRAMHLLNLPRIEVADKRLVRAAVLVPIVWRGDVPHFIFTTRTMSVAHHKGQISFPGGAFEPSDKGPEETALRESEEEIGLERDRVRVLGCMDDLETITSFAVTPVVGIVDERATFRANQEEVADIFELPVEAFHDPSRHRTDVYEYDGKSRTVHIYEIENRTVWGITAEIVFQFVSSLN